MNNRLDVASFKVEDIGRQVRAQLYLLVGRENSAVRLMRALPESVAVIASALMGRNASSAVPSTL
jgi:hypothetical protein